MTFKQNLYTYSRIIALLAVVLPFLSFGYGIGWGWSIAVAGLLIWSWVGRRYMHWTARYVPLAVTLSVTAVALGRLYTDFISVLWIVAAAGLLWQYALDRSITFASITVKFVSKNTPVPSISNYYFLWGIIVCIVGLFFNWTSLAGSANMMLVSPNWQWNPGTGGMNIANNYLLLPGALNSIPGHAMPYGLAIRIILLVFLHLGISGQFAAIMSGASKYKQALLLAYFALVLWWLIYGLGSLFSERSFMIGPILFAAGLALIGYWIKLSYSSAHSVRTI